MVHLVELFLEFLEKAVEASAKEMAKTSKNVETEERMRKKWDKKKPTSEKGTNKDEKTKIEWETEPSLNIISRLVQFSWHLETDLLKKSS